MMKVLLAMPLASREGGAENMLWSLLRHLDRSRIEPLVVFLEAGPFQSEVEGLGIPTLVVRAGRMRQAWTGTRAVLSLARVLRQERPDLVLSWMDRAHLYIAPAAALARTSAPLIWWQHGLPDPGFWLHRLFNLLPARAILCSSDSASRRQRGLWPERTTYVVHPGVPAHEPEDHVSRRATRARLGVPQDRAVIGIVGRLDPWKRQDLVIRVLADLRRRGFEVHGLVVGGEGRTASRGYEARLHRLAADLGLRERVSFTGHMADPLPWVGAMDVLVNASTEEPFGLTLLEAMTMGVPVVAFDAGGPAEIIESGVSGMLVPPDDERALADGIVDLLLDPSIRSRLSRNGRRRFQQRFTAEAMCERFTSLVESLRMRPSPRQAVLR